MTNLFRYNLLLAVGWCALQGELTVANLMIGFCMGFIALAVSSPMFQRAGYYTKMFRIIKLLLYFAWECVESSAWVIWDVLTPDDKSKPAILAVPLDLEEPLQIAVLANLISLTPGSLSLDVSPDQKYLYVHGMFVDDPDEARQKIKAGLERMVQEAMK